MYKHQSLLDLVKIKKDISILKVYTPLKAEAVSILKSHIAQHVKEVTFSFAR